MKLKLSILIFLVACFLFLIPSVHASYSQAYSDYQFQYSQYRTTYQNYQIAKSAYLTYKTLATQNDALEKMRAVLLARTAVLNTYLTLIDEKMLITEGLSKETRDTFNGISQKEQTWLADNQRKVMAASNLKDLNSVASDFASRYPQISKESNLGISQILFAKTDLAYSKIGNFFPQISQVLTRLDDLGEDTTIYKRGLASSQAKADLYQDKKDAALKETEFLKTQKLLQEGLEYIKESASYLKEILNNITGV